MDNQALVAATAALASFSDATRLYALQGDEPFSALQVERWSGSEGLSSLYCWTIDALGSDASLSLDAMLGQRLALRSTLAGGDRILRSGLVSEARCLGSDGGLARYRLSLVPWLWLLSAGRHSRIFQNQSVLDIAAAMFADYSPYASWKVTADAHTLLANVRPRSYAVQYRETDLDFVNRLLAEEGLGYHFVEDTEAGAGHTLVIFADSGQLPEDASSSADPLGRGIRFHRSAAVEASDTIQMMGQAQQLAPDAVTLLSYDYKTLSSTSASATLAGAQGQREAYDPVGMYAFADQREAQHYAQLAAQAHEAQQQRWEGRGTVRMARAGSHFRLAGAPWENQGTDAGNDFVWTALWHAGINNLPESLKQLAQQHLGDAEAPITAITPALWQQAEAVGYAQHFDAVAQNLSWRPALEDEHGLRLNPRPTAPGVQSAIVVGPEGETSPGATGPLHTDNLGRLKVKFHWMTEGASCWLRSVQRYAGSGHGSQFLPRIGQEVLVQFMGGDIDRPLIVGALYNGQGEAGIAPSPGDSAKSVQSDSYAQATDFAPSAQANLAGGNSPAWHGISGDAAGHANAAALSGVKTQGFDGNGYNQLVMDDTDEQGRLQFATTQAATQLNLGHLIHQADNYRGSFRGSGMELRTDGYGAVRGSRGLLLSTYAISSSEPAADVTAASALLKQHAQQAEALSQAATTHTTVPLAGHEGVAKANASELSDKAAPLKALQQSLAATVKGDDYASAAPEAGDSSGDVPHSANALLTVAGRAGIGAIAGQALHVAAGETLNLGSGQHTNIAVADQLRVHSGQAVGMLAGAQKADGVGLSLIASKGAVDMQAQHDTLALKSKGDMKLVSANAAAEFAAKKTIHLAVSGGAHLTIEGGNITFGCPGKIMVHAGNHQFVGATHLSREMNSWDEPKFNDKYRAEFPNGDPAKNYRYELTRADGAKIHGITDADGIIPLQQGIDMEALVIKLLGPAGEGEPT